MILIFRDANNAYVCINLERFVVEIGMPTKYPDPDSPVMIHTEISEWEVVSATAERIRNRLEAVFHLAEMNCLEDYRKGSEQ